MQIRKPILLVLIWLLMVALGAFWIWQSLQAKLIVENRSRDYFTDVTVIVANALVWTGSISAGTKIKTRFFPNNDSASVMEGKWQGRNMSSSMGYTTLHDTLLHTITLTPNGEFLHGVTR